ncbi:MAG: ABC transporter permease [Actinomycetota bacterium]
MRNLFAIAGKDLKLRIRDRSLLIVAVLAPLVLAFIFNAVFGSALQGGVSFEPKFGIVQNASPRTSAILQQISTGIGGAWEVFGSRQEAEEAIDAGQIDAVFVVGEGLDGAIDQGRGGTLEVIGNVDSETATEVATSIAKGYGQSVGEIQLSIAAALTAGGHPAQVIPAATDEGVTSTALVGEVKAEVRQLDATTSTVAAMAVFFLMFTSQVGFLSLLEERRDGTLARILSSPTRPWQVVAAKSLVSVLLGLASLFVVMVVGRFLMGAQWGNPAGVALLVVAAVAAASGISALTTGLASTPEAAGNIQGIVGTVLGLLGGVFFPIGEEGGLLSRISGLTPHHWFMRGLADLADGQGASAAAPAALPLLVIAAITALAAALFIRRQVAR